MKTKSILIITIIISLFTSFLLFADDKPSKIYGSELTLKKTTQFQKAFKNPVKFKNQKILLSGIVTDVCQNTGCWFEITDGKDKIRIKSNHQFFVPYDSKGKKVKVQGKIYTKIVSETSHCDVNEDEAQKIKKENKVVLFDASGVAMEGGSEFTQEQLDKIKGKSKDDEQSDHKHDH